MQGRKKLKEWREFQKRLQLYDPLEVLAQSALEGWRYENSGPSESEPSPAFLEYAAGVYSKRPLPAKPQSEFTPDALRSLKARFREMVTAGMYDDALVAGSGGSSGKARLAEASTFTALYHQIVRGEAYPLQLWKAAKDQFGANDNALKKIVGLDAGTIVSIFQWLSSKVQSRVQSHLDEFIGILDEANRRLELSEGVSPPKRKHPIGEIANTEYFQNTVALHNAKARTLFILQTKDLEGRFGSLMTQRFLGRFSSSFGSINTRFETASDYNQLNERPILAISDTEFLVPAPILLSAVPVRTLHYDLIRVPGYGPTYERLRGEYYEKTTSANLSRVFGPKNVFRNLKFGGKNPKGEIDVLVIFDNKLIIVQCKSKGLTLPAKQGSSDSILHDFSRAIQDSYEQGQRARDYFLSSSVATLTDLKGESMRIAREDIRDVFLISVTSETFASLSTNLSLLLKKRASDPFPWVASIFDLELVCEYIPDPYQLVHFLRRRQLAYGRIESPDEMEYVGCYLQQGLWFEKALTGKFTKVVIDGYTRDFDVDQFRKQYGIATFTRIGSSWSNPSFSNLLGTLRILGDKGHSDMILTLLDLGSGDREKLIELIEDTVAKTASDGTHHDFTLLYDNFGLSFVANYGRSGLRDMNIGMSAMKKYRHRKQLWLGLGRDVTDERYLVNEFCFIDEQWAYNVRMQKLASRLRGEKIKLTKHQNKLK